MFTNDIPMKIMLVHDRGSMADNSKISDLVQSLEQNNIEVVSCRNIHEALILYDDDMDAAIIDWDLHASVGHKAAREIIAHLMQHKTNLPFFLFVNVCNSDGIFSDILAMIDGLIWLDEKTDQIVGDIASAIRRHNVLAGHTTSACEGVHDLKPNTGWKYCDIFGENMSGKNASANSKSCQDGMKKKLTTA